MGGLLYLSIARGPIAWISAAVLGTLIYLAILKLLGLFNTLDVAYFFDLVNPRKLHAYIRDEVELPMIRPE